MATQVDYEAARAAIKKCGGLIGRRQMQDEWGVSRARVYQFTSMADFPTPVAAAGEYPVWLADEVHTWREERIERFG